MGGHEDYVIYSGLNRDLECLIYRLKGLTRDKISEKMGVSPNSVKKMAERGASEILSKRFNRDQILQWALEDVGDRFDLVHLAGSNYE